VSVWCVYVYLFVGCVSCLCFVCGVFVCGVVPLCNVCLFVWCVVFIFVHGVCLYFVCVLFVVFMCCLRGVCLWCVGLRSGYVRFVCDVRMCALCVCVFVMFCVECSGVYCLCGVCLFRGVFMSFFLCVS